MSGIVKRGDLGDLGLAVRDASVLDRLQASRVVPPAAAAGFEALLLALDGSGSMFGESWNALYEAVRALVEVSDPKACWMGLLIFSDAADIVCPITDDLQRIATRMPLRPPGGGTGMKQALKLAMQEDWPPGATVRRVILLSDGMPTLGDPVPMASDLGSSGVVIDTVGCGDADERVLSRIAIAGRGKYVHCSRVRELRVAFKALESKARGLLAAPK